MNPEELRVEFVLIKNDVYCSDPIIINLRHVGGYENGVLAYVTEYNVEDTGFYSYGVRVLPHNPMLFQQQDIGLVYWG